MKTPMQELIEQLKEERDGFLKLPPHSGARPENCFGSCIKIAERMLEKEKAAIMNAYQEGKWTGWQNHKLKINNKEYQWTDHAEYFNETFNIK